jgi:hypothetical protein
VLVREVIVDKDPQRKYKGKNGKVWNLKETF